MVTDDIEGIKECCKVEGNLVTEQVIENELTISTCSQCGCRHFELTVDPVSIGMVVGGMG